MSTKPDGGPAFPGISHSYGENEIVDGHSQPYTGLSTYEGMTVRDWFAGLAMQGSIADGALQRISASVAKESDSINAATVAHLTNQLLASMTYEIADAMLEARKATA